MKRILIFSIAYQPFIGGAEVAIKEITDRISQSEIEFDMITLRFDAALPRFEKIRNVNVHRIGFTSQKPTMGDLVRFPLSFNKYLFPFLALKKASQLHAQKPYDATWAMMANYAGFGAVFFKMKFSKIPFLLTLQEGDPIDYIKRRVRFVYPLFIQIFKRADHIQVISQYLADLARSMGYTGSLNVIPNGVDLQLFSQSFHQGELDAVKKKLGKKDGDVFLITTSRLVLKNAVDDSIKAMGFLPKNFHLLIIGTGPDEDALKKLSARSGLSDRVHLLGEVSNTEVPKYLKVSDIFIRPSLSEGMGISFIEAMAAGIPIITTPVGGIVDFLFDPEKNPDKPATGLFCEVRNPESIARQAKRLMEQADLRSSIIKNAHVLVAEKYDWKLLAERMREEVFKKVLA